MKISDYAKIEELKRILTTQMLHLGMEDKVNGIVDADLNKLIQLMSALNKFLLDKETEDEKIDFLINYIIGLWGILIVDYGHKLEEL